MQSAQQALLGELRREDTAVKQTQHVQAELAATQGLLAANQRELQRNLMVMKFRNAEVERLRVCALPDLQMELLAVVLWDACKCLFRYLKLRKTEATMIQLLRMGNSTSVAVTVAS